MSDPYPLPRGLRDDLDGICASFFAFLDRRPKPADGAVRWQFLKHQKKWFERCDRYRIASGHKRAMFNKVVSLAWKTKYTARSGKSAGGTTPPRPS